MFIESTFSKLENAFEKISENVNGLAPICENTKQGKSITMSNAEKNESLFIPWYEVAKRFLGTKEVPGIHNNPKISEFFTHTNLGAQPDSVPWCAAFANYCIEQAGQPGTGRANARSFCSNKNFTQLENPSFGCIVVIPRGDNPAQGHVGFLKSWTKVDDGYELEILGGNQGDEVCIKKFHANPVGFYWPTKLVLAHGV